MPLGKALRAAASSASSRLLLDRGLPIISRIQRAVAAEDSSSPDQLLYFHKEELVYQLSLPKRRWVLIKKIDTSSSITAWVPGFCLAKPEPGPYRVKEELYGRDVGVEKGEIVQVTDIDLRTSWCFEKLDHTRARGRIHPCHLEKADITTEPPPPILNRSALSLVISEENRMVRAYIADCVRGLFGRRKSASVAEDRDGPPPYSV